MARGYGLPCACRARRLRELIVAQLILATLCEQGLKDTGARRRCLIHGCPASAGLEVGTPTPKKYNFRLPCDAGLEKFFAYSECDSSGLPCEEQGWKGWR